MTYDDVLADEAKKYTRDDLDRIGRQWLEKITASEKREERWTKEASNAEAIYLADEDEADAGLLNFNILHSNIETIVPSIYNSSPEPDVRPRHNNKDEVAKVVSDILERAISTQVDDSRLDSEIEASAQDAFMAGRGVVRVRFDAQDVPAQMAMAITQDPYTGETFEQEIEVSPAGVTGERVIYEVVSWRDYREGPGSRWDQVPWVAFRHEVTEQERQRLEDKDMAEAQRDDENTVDEDKNSTIWEIWCKETGKVYFVIAESGTVLDIKEDPLGLTDFFPMAKPVQPITATGKRTPVCPYTIYKKLAQELDQATKRINSIMKGLKVRGIIAADAQVADLISDVGDNELAAVANIENLVAVGGLEKAIMWWPVEQSIKVLQQLYVQREQTKQSIYEITGISDIIRGQGAASETATAQQIKTEWGSLRIKKMQRQVERQVRDLFVMSAEIISRHFSFDTLQKMTGIEITEDAAQLLQSPMDNYRIDVESDSTVRADTQKSRSEMSAFLQGTGQFFGAMEPVVRGSPKAAAPIAKMFASFARQFSLGKSGEDAISELAEMAEAEAKAPQQPSPEQQAQQAEMQRKNQEMQAKMQEMQAKFQIEVQKLQLEAQNLQIEKQIKQAELGLKQADLQIKRDNLTLEEAKATVNAAATAAEIDIEIDQERAAKIESVN